MLNLKHLYYFYVFAQDRSIKEAAKRLSISGPALSNQLKQLEEFVGVPLTRRIAGKAVFTQQGEMVLHFSERMFAAYEELKTKLLYARDLTSKPFRVGISQSIGARFSLELLSLVAKSNFSVAQRVDITFDLSDKLAEGFIHDQFDMVLGTFTPEFTGKNDWISQQLASPIQLFGPRQLIAEFPKLTKQSASNTLPHVFELANARKIPLILPQSPCILRDETEKFLSGCAIRPLRTIECNSTSAIVQLIERDFALGFLPAPCLLEVNLTHAPIVLGPKQGYWSHTISILAQKGTQLSSFKNPNLSDVFSAAEFN